MISKRKKGHDKKPWLILVLLSLFFYGAMLLLTVTSKDIHAARLPKVTASRPEKQSFTYFVTIENGTIEQTSSFTALPKDMVDSGKVFRLQSVTENDFTYYYARQLTVTIDKTKENDDYYAISDGLMFGETIIMTGYKTLKDGDEVNLIKEKPVKSEELHTEDLFQ